MNVNCAVETDASPVSDEVMSKTTFPEGCESRTIVKSAVVPASEIFREVVESVKPATSQLVSVTFRA